MIKRFLKTLKKALYHFRRLYGINNIFRVIQLEMHGVKCSETIIGRHFVSLGVRGTIIGKAVEFGDNVRIQGGAIIIGTKSYIGHNNYIYGKVSIGENFMSGPNVSFMGGNHGFADLGSPMAGQKTISKGIQVGNDVWVGCNSVILDGVQIGDHTIVGAGSVVTKSLVDSCIYAGNPAKLIRKR